MLEQRIQQITLLGGSKISSNRSGESTGVAISQNLSIARSGVVVSIDLFIFSSFAILFELLLECYLNVKTFYRHYRHKAQNRIVGNQIGGNRLQNNNF